MSDRADEQDKRVSRRTFLGGATKTVGVAAALPLLGSPSPSVAGGGKTKVVLVTHPKVIDGSGKVQAPLVRQMIDRAMTTLTGKNKLGEAWGPFIEKGKPIGLKLNTLGLGELVGSSFVDHYSAVTFALVDQLREIGVPDKDLIVWDRSDRELANAGLTVQRELGKLRIMGVKKDRSGDAGPDEYHPKLYQVGDKQVRLCRLLTDHCQTLINVPLLKHHRTARITGALKSHFGSIDNPGQFHRSDCITPGIPELNAIGLIRKKQRLIVADCLMGLFDGGPWWDRSNAWPFGGILVGTDPVAVDTVLSQLMDEKRKAKHLKPLTPTNHQLKLCAKLGLGTCELDRIDLQKIVLS